ncbi:MAG: mce related family protein, partial [Rhizobacter sp.]|nr:mce related family protein [Rhizobacter sp.]
MAETTDQDPVPTNGPAAPRPVVRRKNRLRLSLVWLVPLAAVLAGALLVARGFLQAGPTITIEFRTAEGLEAGRTEVRYKEVVIGRVSGVSLNDNRDRVVA